MPRSSSPPAVRRHPATTALACPPCGLRFGPPQRSTCPECGGRLTTLGSSEQAVGLQLFVAPEISLPALEAAIAGLGETGSPPPR